MAPYVPEARMKLSYPLYGADFDPLNQDFLLVGGGGGSTSSGVPNKISLIDASRTGVLAEIADIELAKDEDSVTTLAVASSTETALTAIAGINSSAKEQQAGKNEHLRSFRIALPRKRKADGSPVEVSEKHQRFTGSQPLGKTALFKSAIGPKNDTYQRVLRASPVQSANQARITAVASGLAPENEVIAFQPVANALTSTVDEISRVSLGKSEAADVDVMAIKDNGHILTFCTDDAVYLQNLPTAKGTSNSELIRLHQDVDATESTPPSERPRFRGIRFLTPKHILVLQNRPGRSGAALGILKLTPDDKGCVITLWKKLRKSTKSAVGLDVCALTESPNGQKQFIIAVAGQDSSIEIFTLNYLATFSFSTFEPFTYLSSVHAGPLTRLTFSNFIGPTLPVSKDTPPQSVRLASVGVDQMVVVHTLRLSPHPTTKTDKPSYILVPPGTSETMQTVYSVLVALLVCAIGVLSMQIFCEIRGAVPPTLGAPNWLSDDLRTKIHTPYIPNTSATQPETETMPEALSSAISAIIEAPSRIPLPNPLPITEQTKDSLSDLISENTLLETPKAIVVRDTGADLSAELHHDADLVKKETLRKWEEMTAHERKGWKARLVDAGHWVEEQGEGVLKGVLFGELANFMG